MLSAGARSDYTANGTDSSYSFGFKISAASHLRVILKDPDTLEEQELVVGTDYTITCTYPGTGSITFVDNGQDWIDADGDLEEDWILCLRRVVPLTQDTDIRNQGEYYPDVTEDRFDRQTMIDQQQQDQIDRSINFDETSDFRDVKIDDLVAGSFLKVNSEESRLEMATASDIGAEFVVTGSRSSPSAITAAGITPTGAQMETMYVEGSGGAIDLTANPQIADGENVGDILKLVGCSDANTLLLEHGTGLVMNGSCTLRDGSVIQFSWNGSDWVEDFRNDL